MSLSTSDFLPELRTWYKVFEKASYRHDYSRVFDDFITMTLTQFCWPGMMDDWHKTAMAPYNEEEKKLFNEMFKELFLVFDDRITKHGMKWYDLFGHCYELLTSRRKASALGQFFTPPTLVDMMNLLMGDSRESTMSDPCCGSGRMLLAFHSTHPGSWLVGMDKDPICVKMTAINMALHGCRGHVACMDTLGMNDFRFAFSINDDLAKLKIPTIYPLKEEEFLGMMLPTVKTQLVAPPFGQQLKMEL